MKSPATTGNSRRKLVPALHMRQIIRRFGDDVIGTGRTKSYHVRTGHTNVPGGRQYILDTSWRNTLATQRVNCKPVTLFRYTLIVLRTALFENGGKIKTRNIICSAFYLTSSVLTCTIDPEWQPPNSGPD